MKKFCLGLSALILPFAVIAGERFDVTETMDIHASADKVWDTVKGFDQLNNWHPAVVSVDILEGNAGEAGAVRLLTLGDGGTIKETLTDYNDAEMQYTYIINEGVLPVKDYESTLRVSAGDDMTTVEWNGSFEATPPEGGSDADVRDLISGIYRAGLEQAKAQLEQ